MKSLLTEQDIRYLLEQQERLDADIRKKHEIPKGAWLIAMDDEHDIALRVEVAEFVNACYKSWKYWKTKPMSRDAVIDEAVDVIHFVMLHHNKSYDLGITTRTILDTFGVARQLEDESEVRERLHYILKYTNKFEILIKLLEILDFYDFDRKQIMEAYKEKNAENFRRLESNY